MHRREPRADVKLDPLESKSYRIADRD